MTNVDYIDKLVGAMDLPQVEFLKVLSDLAPQEGSEPYDHTLDSVLDACAITNPEVRQGIIKIPYSKQPSMVTEAVEKQFTKRELAFLTVQLNIGMHELKEKISDIMLQVLSSGSKKSDLGDLFK